MKEAGFREKQQLPPLLSYVICDKLFNLSNYSDSSFIKWGALFLIHEDAVNIKGDIVGKSPSKELRT